MQKQKRIIVIGANSFSGSNLINFALNQKYNVTGVSRSKEPNDIFLPYKWANNKNLSNADKYKYIYRTIDLNHDINKLIKLIDDVRPEFIINFAAQGMVAESWQNPTDWYQTNVVSQVAFHDQLRKRKFLEKYIHITTPEVYGSTNDWIKENNNFSPSTPYAVSRASCDLHLLSFFKAYDFPVVFTRAANVYGAGQQLYRIIPRTILSALTKKKIYLHGGGKSIRSFIHINDVANATLKITEKASPGTTWHISTKETISIRDLVYKIFRKLNVDPSGIVVENNERLGKDQSYLLDSSSLRENLGWEEKISLNEGISETINWVENNIEIMKELPWEYIHKS